MSPRRATGFRITDRDVAIVRWIGRLRMASADQIAGRFGLGRAVAYARLGGLVRLGLLEHQRIFHGSAGVYLATRAGLDTAGVGLPPATVDIRSYVHDLELSSVVAQLEAEFDSALVVTEREIRARDIAPNTAPDGRSSRYACRRAEASSRSPLSGTRDFTSRTLPWSRERACDRWRSSWSAHQRDERGSGGILSAYVAARHLDGVRYIVDNDAVERLVRSEADALRAGSMIEIVWSTHVRDQERQRAA